MSSNSQNTLEEMKSLLALQAELREVRAARRQVRMMRIEEEIDQEKAMLEDDKQDLAFLRASKTVEAEKPSATVLKLVE